MKSTRWLRVSWSKRERDLRIQWPEDKADGHLAHMHLCSERPRVERETSGLPKFHPSFVSELERRGYDLTTLVFQIAKKPAPPSSGGTKP